MVARRVSMVRPAGGTARMMSDMTVSTVVAHWEEWAAEKARSPA